MKKTKIGRIIAGALVCSASLFMFAGCSSDDKKEAVATNSDAVYFQYSDIEIPENVVMIYALQELLDGQKQYTFVEQKEDLFKQNIEDAIAKDCVLYKRALDENMEFTEDDIKSKDTLVANFKTNIPENVLEKYGITDKLLDEIITRQSYALKYASVKANELGKKLQEEYLVEYADYNFQTTYVMAFPKVEVDTSGNIATETDGSNAALDADTLNKVYEQAKKAADEINAGADAKEVAKTYGISSYCSEQTAYVGAYSAELNDVMAELKSGQCTDVMENDNCYYIIAVLTDHDEDYLNAFTYQMALDNAQEEYEKQAAEWVAAATATDAQYETGLMDKFSLIDMAKYLVDEGIMVDLTK